MATRLIALLVLGFSLLPVANLLPGGEGDPEYWARLLDWAYGLALCAGVGGLVAYVVQVRRRSAAGAAGDVALAASAASSTRTDGGSAPGEPPAGSAGRAFLVAASLLAGLLYALLAQRVFSGRPLLIDEIVQVLQARWYADGMLAVPVPPQREFFSILHLVDLGDMAYSQFPVGGPAMLALGALVGAEWLVGPAAGVLAVVLFGRLLTHLEPGASRAWHRGAIALFALAPFGAFMFASHMNHVTALAWRSARAWRWVARPRATTRTQGGGSSRDSRSARPRRSVRWTPRHSRCLRRRGCSGGRRDRSAPSPRSRSPASAWHSRWRRSSG